jgi:DNA polymerase III psi subunit
MAETAAHLTDHVLPRLPVRQWVLSVPKRLRYFVQRVNSACKLCSLVREALNVARKKSTN